MAQGSFDRAAALEQLGAETFDVLVDRRRHHRRRRGPRRRQPRPAHRARRAGRLRQRHVVEELEARARRAALPAERRRPPRVRGAARAPAAAPQRPAPRAAAARSSSRSSRRTASSTRRWPGRSGSAMWMYDLTGGARIGKLHKRLKKAQAVAHMPTLPEERLAGAYLYYDAAADDARLTLTILRTAALDHGAVVANHAERRRAAPRRAAGPRARWSRPTAAHRGARPGGRERHRRVERRRARARRGRRPRQHPAGQGHPHHRAVGQGPQRHRRGRARCRRTSAACSSCRGCRPTTAGSSSPTSAPPTPTTTGRSTTRSAPPTTSPTCSGPSTCSVREPLTEADVLGTWAGLRPLVKAASSGRTADLSRRHKVTRSESGVDHRHRRQAHDLPRDGRGHRRRAGRRTSTGSPARPAGAAPRGSQLRGAQRGRRRRPTGTRPPPRRPLRQRGRRRCRR